ncbi:MAG TPA: glycosyltransferase family 4 protein [Pyrinomonadaceae bacterium]|nr:glycosyltransferase family 4 protein [Pyrinomonadaceae bacterium]
MTGPALRVAWLTNAPSADQIDLLTALAARPEVDLSVFYCSPKSTKGEVHFSAPSGRGAFLSGPKLPGPAGGFFLNPSIVGVLTRSSYDVLIVSGYAHATMQLAMLVRAVQGKPWLLFAERAGMVQNYGHAVGRKLAMVMVRSAAGIIATGRLAEEAFARQFGSSRRLFSLPYLINHEEFLRLPRPQSGAADVSFMACGSLIRRKGIDVLITAFQQAAQVRSDISLTIVGDGPEMQALKDSVTSDCRDRITFRGAISFNERPQIFGEADVFIHPARHDGWGVVIHEALAAGLPVIATRETGAAYELVQDGRNGFLVDAEDEATLAERILWFADNRPAIESFSRDARAAVAGLTPEWGAAELVRITQSVASDCKQ